VEIEERAGATSHPPMGAPSARMIKIMNHLLDSTIVAHGSILDRVFEKVVGLSRHAKMWEETGGMSIRRWLNVYNMCGGFPLRKGVFLDVKSTQATTGQLLLLVESIGSLGIYVWGVGSFAFHHLDAIGRGRPQVIRAPAPAPSGGEEEAVSAPVANPTVYPPFLPIYLLSHIAELPPLLETAIGSGGIPRGASVLFNGGSMIESLLREPPASAGSGAAVGSHVGFVTVTPPSLVDELRKMVHEYDLKLGYYVQETTLGAKGASLLIEIANSYPKIFPLGFACSNLPGLTAEDIPPCSTGFSLPQCARWLFFPKWKAAQGTRSR
jgi:hypothetical protein